MPKIKAISKLLNELNKIEPCKNPVITLDNFETRRLFATKYEPIICAFKHIQNRYCKKFLQYARKSTNCNSAI